MNLLRIFEKVAVALVVLSIVSGILAVVLDSDALGNIMVAGIFGLLMIGIFCAAANALGLVKLGSTCATNSEPDFFNSDDEDDDKNKKDKRSKMIDINPVTGYAMCGGLDIRGNPIGRRPKM